MATIIAENLKLIPLPKNTLVVARRDGRLYVADFTEFPQLDDPGIVDWSISISKIIMGKAQANRTRLLTLEELTVENIVHTGQIPEGATEDFEITVFGSMDGKNISKTVKPVIQIDDGGFIKAYAHVTATNFSIQLRGTYNLNTFTLTYHNHGRR